LAGSSDIELRVASIGRLLQHVVSVGLLLPKYDRGEVNSYALALERSD